MRFRFLLSDVSIQIIHEYRRISPVVAIDEYTQVNDRDFHFFVPQLAHFYAQNGKKIEILPIGKINPKAIELYLNGSVLGAILHQRHHLPLHASAFRYQGKTVVLCGNSGAGKSTTLAAFLKEGAEFLTDDITPVHLESNTPSLQCISDHYKLWGDSMDLLGLKKEKKQEVWPKMDKYFVQPDTLSDRKSIIQMDVLFFLQPSDFEEVSVEELIGHRKVEMLIENVYRGEYLAGMKAAKNAYFPLFIRMAETIPMYLVRRPANHLNTLHIEALKNILRKP